MPSMSRKTPAPPQLKSSSDSYLQRILRARVYDKAAVQLEEALRDGGVKQTGA